VCNLPAVARVCQSWNWVTFCDPATQWPGNPATRRPSWPGNPVLWWTPNVDLCVTKYSQAKEFLIIIGKSKSSLHGPTSSTTSDLSPTTDTWQWLVISAFQMYVLHFGHFFRKPEKLGSHHTGSKWWPGDPDVKGDPNDPLTRWPSSISGVCCLGCSAGTYGAGCRESCQCEHGARCDPITGAQMVSELFNVF